MHWWLIFGALVVCFIWGFICGFWWLMADLEKSHIFIKRSKRPYWVLDDWKGGN